MVTCVKGKYTLFLMRFLLLDLSAGTFLSGVVSFCRPLTLTFYNILFYNMCVNDMIKTCFGVECTK